MSWTYIRPYFRTHLDALELREWKDGFNFENIPSDIFDGAYHIEFGDFSGESQDQVDLMTLVRVTCRIFKKGYADPQAGIDEMIALLQEFIETATLPENKLNETFKGLLFVSALVRAYDETNDNKIVGEVSFDVRAVLC